MATVSGSDFDESPAGDQGIYKDERIEGTMATTSCPAVLATASGKAGGLWYRRAIAYLPRYVKARVHLAEIYASQGQTADAEALLLPVLSSRDPEVRWRLADVLIAQERFDEAEIQLDAARSGFEELLRKHLLAFADHAAEFYAGSGNDCRRALALARANVANRPTRRAAEQVQRIVVNPGEALNGER
jgi:hypothetical protein